jgi:hypothetical protein
VLDFLIRRSDILCAPHLPSVFKKARGVLKTQKGVKKSAISKSDLSLEGALVYVIQSCFCVSDRSSNTKKRTRRRYRGALIPYSVHSENTLETDHANMIFLDFSNREIRCHLFEPNGSQFTRKYPSGIRRLREAWEQVVVALKEHRLDDTVHIIGADIESPGIQTLLGRYSRATTRTSTGTTVAITRNGYAICGAITYWMFTEWIKTSPLGTFDSFYRRAINEIGEKREVYQRQILTFIRTVREEMEQNYESAVKKALDKDLQRIEGSLQKLEIPTNSAVIKLHIRAGSPHNENIQMDLERIIEL